MTVHLGGFFRFLRFVAAMAEMVNVFLLTNVAHGGRLYTILRKEPRIP